MGLNAEEFDWAYSRLCEALTDVGDERTQMVLARLVLLLIHEAADLGGALAAIDDAAAVNAGG
ncbi:MAG: hypothetical protein ACRD0Z_10570 [Acidimicrobiales bacterium]